MPIEFVVFALFIVLSIEIGIVCYLLDGIKMVEELQDYANAQYVQSDKDFTKIFDDLLEDMNDYYDMQEEHLMSFTDADDNATRSAYR